MIGSTLSNLAALQRVRDQAIASVSAGEDVHAVLHALILGVEAQSANGLLASVLILDETGRRLRHGAAPSLPDAYNQAIDGVEIGPAVGSCGTAAFYGEPVYVADIRLDPIWAAFAPLAKTHGLRACWSMPVKDDTGQVLGTFANYYREPRLPTAQDVAAINYLADVVAQVITRRSALAQA